MFKIDAHLIVYYSDFQSGVLVWRDIYIYISTHLTLGMHADYIVNSSFDNMLIAMTGGKNFFSRHCPKRNYLCELQLFGWQVKFDDSATRVVELSAYLSQSRSYCFSSSSDPSHHQRGQ